MTTRKRIAKTARRINTSTSTEVGAAWFKPSPAPNAKGLMTGELYAGHLGDENVYFGRLEEQYKAGAFGEISADVQAKIVLQDLLGLSRPQYKLDACVRTVPCPELTKTVGVATKGTGTRNVKMFEESEITGSAPTPVTLDCHPNEYHIVVSKKAERQGAWDMLSNYVQDGAQEIAHMRNQDIAEALYEATDAATGEEWDDQATPGLSDHNPLTQIGVEYDVLAALGYPPNFIAMYGSDWSHFITNTHIAVMVQAGVLGRLQGGAITLPGYDDVRVINDYSMTAAHAVLGNNRGIVLGDGGTEAVKYVNDRQRYTGYLIRQWLDVQLVDANCARDLTGIA